jgi:hypothetical protein
MDAEKDTGSHDHLQMLRDEHRATLWTHHLTLLLGLWLITNPFTLG